MQRYEYAQLLMGVKTRLILYAPEEPSAQSAATAAFARVAELEDIFSDYRRTSELMRLCDRAGRGPVPVSPDLFAILSRAQQISRDSDGAFDITIGPCVALWRQARKTHQFPSPDALANARVLVDYRLLKLDENSHTAELLKPGMRLDLGGIAKGYAGFQALLVLQQHGIESALYQAGGDILVSNAPPDSPAGWSIAIPSPAADQPSELHIQNSSVSTSGDTVQFIEFDGKRYSHILDPHTGLGLTTHCVATVIAPLPTLTDGLSSAACVLGIDRVQMLRERYPAACFYVHNP